MAGGSITGVSTNNEPMEVIVIDYDIENCQENELTLTPMRDGSGLAKSFIFQDTADCEPEWIRSVVCAVQDNEEFITNRS